MLTTAATAPAHRVSTTTDRARAPARCHWGIPRRSSMRRSGRRATTVVAVAAAASVRHNASGAPTRSGVSRVPAPPESETAEPGARACIQTDAGCTVHPSRAS